MQLSLFSPRAPVKTPATPDLTSRIRAVLGPRLPAAAVERVVAQVTEQPVSLKVVKHRTSKTGDFRPPHPTSPARITVNGNLNPYAFLITLVHELAHHHVDLAWRRSAEKFTLRRKRRPQPHGKEWKEMFRQLMEPYLSADVFPAGLLTVLAAAMENPRASSSAEPELAEALRAFDPPGETLVLEELAYDAIFSLHGRRIFLKKEKVRTRYRCICMKTNRIYLVSAKAPVEVIQ